VDFSEARNLFVNIFQILGPNCKITDCGLILEKQRGLSAKSAKTGPWVDFKETQGLLCKIPRNIDLTNYFPTVKVMERVNTPVDHKRRWPTVDHGHCPGGGSPEIGQNGVPVRGTSPEGGGESDTTGRQWGTIGGGDDRWRGSCELGSTRLRVR
jgi:hypothetical protein